MDSLRTGVMLGLASLGTLVSFASCSSTSSGPTGTEGGISSDGSSSGSSSGAGSSSGSSSGSSGGNDSGGEGSSSVAYVGGIAAAIQKSGTTSVYVIGGGFYATPKASGSTCGGTTSGSCCYLPAPTSLDAGTGLGALVSAGTVTVDDGTTTLATITPGTAGNYVATSATDPTVKWTAGQTLAVEGSGGVVDAFSGNIVTVVDIAGVKPAVASGTTTTIPESAAFKLTWTPGAGATDEMALILTVISGPAAGSGISCTVKDSVGSVTVDKVLLAKIGGAASGTIGLQRTSIDTVTTGNVLVELTSNTTLNGSVSYTP